MEIGKSSRKSLHLHEEIIEEEILPRLSVKSLLRVRCVSKSWGSLIGSKRFIKRHHQNSKKNPCFLQQSVIIDTYLGEWPHRTLKIVGCCNGLLCILEEEEEKEEERIRIQLWNPSTRISKKLPEISNPGFIQKFGFGWVESSDEYKVFVSVFGFHDSQGIGKVYSSKTKSWKTIEMCPYLHSSWSRGVFAGGKLYWKSGLVKLIICLDLKSEVFGRIEFPLDQEYYGGTVGVLGGFLCVLCDNYKIGFRVWVMKESWERVATFAHLVELLQPAPLVVGLKGEILVNCGSFVVVYYCRDNVFRDPKLFCEASCACQDIRFRNYEDCARSISYEVYAESLVSPKDL
ncbi:F-box/kelch-repeat protein At3g23880-like [Salvia miltiorrhiza]|uniref:F-box/kelch-repeat protein At3g23880-like n=1 Tax=Salvia miltiorrhiza TaxID=226208 RepID=UPI0025AD81EB|nr:F-box/kelch-repeat protein At3g23880-like [Salvia miltiorrhiza]